jgi:hypothetical protein
VELTLVTQSLLFRHDRKLALAGFDTSVAPNPHSSSIVLPRREIFLTVRGCASFGVPALGRKGRLAMFEMLTAAMGLVGAGIFLAHAFEGVLSRT